MHINCRYATELACRDNELGYMFYHNLGGSYKDNLSGDRTIGDVTLTNIQNGYWSSTEIDDNGAWGFWFNLGLQDFIPYFKVNDRYGWAVRDGDVVPEPPMVLLLATGLIGLIGLARIRAA
jgi:hypothetical protein